MNDERKPSPTLSIVIPVWGKDARFLSSLFTDAGTLDPAVECIVAAVAPGPALRELARQNRVRLVCCPTPSRGAQMNRGANQARGHLLCFHHADTALSPSHMRALLAVAAEPDIAGGAFYRQFDNRHYWMRWWQKLVERFDRRFGPFFGDQSIFVRMTTFRELGGFADIPIMEDLEFAGRLKRAGKVKCLHPAIRSSPRRFRRLGTLLTSALNAIFILLYYAGVSPRRLHRWYYHEKRSSLGAHKRRRVSQGAASTPEGL